MKKQKGILIWKKDIEDGWVMGGAVFPVSYTRDFIGAVNELKPQLESPEFIEWLIDEHCLLDDLFEGDKSFQFKEIKNGFYFDFIFENSHGETRTHSLSTEFVYLPKSKKEVVNDLAAHKPCSD